jgi:1,4-dihydroxy-6-naphthoate synthase
LRVQTTAVPARFTTRTNLETTLPIQNITVGHSPDPDDAFMFYALTHGKIDTGELRFQEVVEDIESLNRRALAGELDVTALSVHAFAYVMDKYAMMTCGGSFGDAVGPIVVAARPMEVGELADVRIAVPGTMTSAYLLLKLLLMNFKFEVIRFDRIMDAVKNGEADAGLLIHEGQIRYQELGLHKVVDLGQWWHADTSLPVPLGVNGVRRGLGKETGSRLVDLLRQSIRYAQQNRPEAVEYARGFGRGMSSSLTDRFVGMYVNPWTMEMGKEGREAVFRLLTRGYHAVLLPRPSGLEFIG